MPALYDSLASLAQGIQDMHGRSPEYVDKMLHKVPAASCVKRAEWLLARLTGQTILHIGCQGPLHEGLLKVCQRAYGIDQESTRYPDFVQMDVDCLTGPLPAYPGVEVVLLAEVLEHLGNPRFLLEEVRERYPCCEVIITVPNAFSVAGQQWMRKGVENVHREHVAYYSYWTLHRLVEVSGYAVQEWYWADGKPLEAEGLIMVCRGQAG